MSMNRELSFEDLVQEPAAASRGTVNVVAYGPVRGIVITESGATIHFERGDITLSTEQAFALLRLQR